MYLSLIPPNQDFADKLEATQIQQLEKWNVPHLYKCVCLSKTSQFSSAPKNPKVAFFSFGWTIVFLGLGNNVSCDVCCFKVWHWSCLPSATVALLASEAWKLTQFLLFYFFIYHLDEAWFLSAFLMVPGAIQKQGTPSLGWNPGLSSHTPALTNSQSQV